MAAAYDSARSAPIHYDAEIRFGVVMYGGVSLAMYINGVANEMYEMASATPQVEPSAPAIGTREIYRRLSWLANDADLRARYSHAIHARQQALSILAADDAARSGPASAAPASDAWDEKFRHALSVTNRVRLVVDVIAGTSAGGINGIFLAKALANGEPFAPLQDLWIKEGDISLLLNDARSYQGMRKYRQSGPPRALLNGDRMYRKLYEAIEGMPLRKTAAGDPGTSSSNSTSSPTSNSTSVRSRASTPDIAAAAVPLIDELDLVVTTTDINGSPIPLRLTDDVVYERRHKRSFHFSYSRDLNNRNDFVNANNSLLAFAARCTSSFPFAFEPMTAGAAARLLDPPAFQKIRDARFFNFLPNQQLKQGAHLWRAFGDGGYLDNKPFSYVANLLAIRQAFVPVERKLLYVEPAPQLIDPDEGQSALPDEAGQRARIPDALSNSFAALTSIPRYETIREDLQVVLKRNHMIERVDRIVREGEIDLHEMLSDESNPYVRILRDKQGVVPPFPDFERDDMVKYYGTAFLAYRRVRVSSVTDKIAERLGELWDTERDSDQHYALSAIVREWRDQHYQENTEGGRYQTINKFLEKYDVDYRIRRLSFLLRQTDHLTRVLRQILRDACIDPQFVLGSAQLGKLPVADARTIQRLHREQLCLLDSRPDIAAIRRALAALKTIKSALNDAQKLWRKRDRMLGQNMGRDHVRIDDALCRKLHEVLSLMLGVPLPEPITLATRNGGSVDVDISEQTRNACSYARSMQESVLIRVRAINDAAGQGAPTLLQDKLEDSIDSMQAAIAGPVTWNMLGRPQLSLHEPAPQPAATQEREGEGEGEDEAPVAHPGVKLNTTVELAGNMVLDTLEGQVIRTLLGEYYVYFDLFDQMSFPLYYETDIGEPATVEVARISPRDARSLVDEELDGRNKLAGTALRNFGGFMDQRWRRNDIMWGRLDGAERLIKTVLPMTDHHTQIVRDELTRQAQLAILRETFLPQASSHLLSMLFKDFTPLPADAGMMQRMQAQLKLMGTRQSQEHQQLQSILSALVSEQNLLNHVRTHDVDRKPDPEATLKNASRAITITGRILEQIARAQGGNAFLMRWLARSGLLFQGLVAVALPGSVFARLWTQTAKMLYLFLLVWVLFALLLGSSAAQGMAVTALLVTVVAHSLILLFGDVMASRHGRMKLWWVLPAFVGLVLAAIGVVALQNLPWCEVMFGDCSDKGFFSFWKSFW